MKAELSPKRSVQESCVVRTLLHRVVRVPIRVADPTWHSSAQSGPSRHYAHAGQQLPIPSRLRRPGRDALRFSLKRPDRSSSPLRVTHSLTLPASPPPSTTSPLCYLAPVLSRRPANITTGRGYSDLIVDLMATTEMEMGMGVVVGGGSNSNNGGGSSSSSGLVVTELSHIKELVRQLEVHLGGSPDLCKHLASQIFSLTERSIGLITSSNLDAGAARRKRSASDAAGLASPLSATPTSDVTDGPFKNNTKKR